MSDELSRRSGRVELAAWDGNEPTVYSDLLETQGSCGTRRSHGAWRVVELFGDVGPFEAHLRWTAGEGAGQQVFVTVPRNTRLSVFARDLVIRAANLYGVSQHVGCMVSDGYAATHNYWEQRGTDVAQIGGGGGTTNFDVPPFGRVVHLEAQDPLTLANYTLGVIDGMSVIRAKWAGNDQPQGGMPLGGALKLEVTFPAGAVYRLVHALNL